MVFAPGQRVRRLIWLAACLATLVACAPKRAPDDVSSLAGEWAFHPGDNPQWAEPGFDDGDWPRLTVPRSWGRQGYPDVYGLAWYRVRVPSRWRADAALGVTVGSVGSAYEIFAGGLRLGGIGRMPPHPRMEDDRHGTYVIPAGARAADGSVVIALRVWRSPDEAVGGAGPVEGTFEVGPLAHVVQRSQLAEVAQLALVIVFLFTAAYHVVLAILHPGTDEYGWFGLVVIEAAIYGFLQTQWKYSVVDDFVLLNKIEHLLLYLLPATNLQFVWVYFREPRPRWATVTQAVLVAAGAAVVIAPELTLALTLLPVLYVVASGTVLASIGLVLGRLRSRDPDALLFGAGMLSLVLTLLNDALVERGLYVGPRLNSYGFVAMVLVMGLSLVVRFRRAVLDLNALRADLEHRVQARTQELTEAYQRMEELALRDGLTQLLNRRALQDRALAGLAAANRKRRPFALAMVDIDHFKVVNDTHGHAAGDQVLTQVAERLASGVRASDDVGRWGGEEFLVLFPESDQESAVIAAERLRVSIESAPIRVEGDLHLYLTVSLGVAVLDDPSASAIVLDGLIRLADDALYRAKANGRNRVVVA